MKWALTVAALMLGGCANEALQPAPPTAGTVQTIRYETGPCFGTCPVYAVTVSSDGQGIFDGKQSTAVTGTRGFAVTAEQFEAFRSRLAPYRPNGERLVAPPNCSGREATDLPSVDIVWTGKGPRSHLYAYYGCDMEGNRAMFEALERAPDALPIEGFIGKR